MPFSEKDRLVSSTGSARPEKEELESVQDSTALEHVHLIGAEIEMALSTFLSHKHAGTKKALFDALVS